MDTRREIEEVCGQAVVLASPLSGGCIGQVYRLDLADGRQAVVKLDESRSPRLDIEGKMLRYLAQHSALPVPEVWHSAPRLLIMSFVAGDSRFDRGAEEHAAELLAALHGCTAPAYGLAWDSLIGGLLQSNTPAGSWIAFFGEQRLRYMTREAVRAGQLPESWQPRVDRLVERLDTWLLEPERPSLIHGDVWTSNVLSQNGQISAFLDPAIYYAHPEIELAFIGLFNTFGEDFYQRYQALRPLAPGFFEERRDIYNLYPLLVHCRLFGGSYVAQVDSIMRHYGC